MTLSIPGRTRHETPFTLTVVISLLAHLVLLAGAALYEATPRKRLFYSSVTMVDLLPGVPGAGSGRASASPARPSPVASVAGAPAPSTKTATKAVPVPTPPQKASHLPPIAPVPVGPPRQAAVARPAPTPPAVPLGERSTRREETLGKQPEPRREPAKQMPRDAPAGSADVARQLSRLESAFSKATQSSAPAAIPREQPAPAPSAEKVAERLSEIKGTLREASSNILVRTGGEGGGGGGGGQGGAGGDPRFKAYYDELERLIKEAWFVSEIDLQRTRRPAILSLRLSREGKLLLADFEERSGNPRFDQSALRAVYKAAPFPPLPPGLGGAYLDLGVRFRPEDYGRQG